jgi:hypothetical protein
VCGVWLCGLGEVSGSGGPHGGDGGGAVSLFGYVRVGVLVRSVALLGPSGRVSAVGGGGGGGLCFRVWRVVNC